MQREVCVFDEEHEPRGAFLSWFLPGFFARRRSEARYVEVNGRCYLYTIDEHGGDSRYRRGFVYGEVEEAKRDPGADLYVFVDLVDPDKQARFRGEVYNMERARDPPLTDVAFKSGFF